MCMTLWIERLSTEVLGPTQRRPTATQPQWTPAENNTKPTCVQQGAIDWTLHPECDHFSGEGTGLDSCQRVGEDCGKKGKLGKRKWVVRGCPGFFWYTRHYGEEGVSARLSLPSYPVCAQPGPCRYSVDIDESVWTKYVALGPCSSCYIESTGLIGLALLAQVSSVQTTLSG